MRRANRAMDIRKAERIPQTVALRKAGMSYREIAKEQNVSIATVHDDLATRKDELYLLTAQEKSAYRADAYRRLSGMMDKLDGLIEQFAPLDPAVEAAYRAVGGKSDKKAIPIQLQIIDGMNKVLKSVREMLGLDAPVEVNFTIEHPLVKPFLAAFFQAVEELALTDEQKGVLEGRLSQFRPETMPLPVTIIQEE